MPTTALNYMGNVKPSARQKAEEVLKAAEARGHKLTHVWGYDPNEGNAEHHSGLAADFMVFKDKAAGDFIADYLWTHRVRLGLVHEIWYRRIRSTKIQPGVWRAMADRGNSTANHLDHVHVWFDASPYKAPSAPVRAVTAVRRVVAKAQPTPTLREGSRGLPVAALQRGLNRVFPAYSRLAVDGDFGPATEAAVKEFQKRSGLRPVDGIVGPLTRAALKRVGISL